MKEKINFIASFVEPNPIEFTYWIDLKTDPTGNVMKSFSNGKWLPLNETVNTNQYEQIAKVESDLSKAIDDETTARVNDIESINQTKADKATTLAGYGITDAMTTTQINNRFQQLIGAAPEAIDTLEELADALNNDPDFAATITTSLSGKVDKVTGKGLSTNDFTDVYKNKVNSSVQCSAYDNIVVVTQDEYDALESPDSRTLYQIQSGKQIVTQYIG